MEDVAGAVKDLSGRQGQALRVSERAQTIRRHTNSASDSFKVNTRSVETPGTRNHSTLEELGIGLVRSVLLARSYWTITETRRLTKRTIVQFPPLLPEARKQIALVWI